MFDEIENPKYYAHLPEDLISKILDNVPSTVNKMNEMFDIQDKPIQKGIENLKKKGLIEKNDTKDFSNSLIAVDGGVVLEKMTGTDILLAVAVGVEGLSEDAHFLDNFLGRPVGFSYFYLFDGIIPRFNEYQCAIIKGKGHQGVCAATLEVYHHAAGIPSV